MQAGRYHLSLFAWHGAIIRLFIAVPDRGYCCEASTSVICRRLAGRPTVAPNHRWRSCFWDSCSMDVNKLYADHTSLKEIGLYRQL
jgi:hypothetical protein